MSAPKHVYVSTEFPFEVCSTAFLKRQLHSFEMTRSRYTLTEGEEWDALMERVRRSHPEIHSSVHALVLCELLDYFGETK